jgi:hypothetical protein
VKKKKHFWYNCDKIFKEDGIVCAVDDAYQDAYFACDCSVFQMLWCSRLPIYTSTYTTLYTREIPSRALPQHQAHLFAIKTLGVLDKSRDLPHFPY